MRFDTFQQMLGTEFNFDYWRVCTPRRSTYPACRAVIAAERQGRGKDMIHAIQQAYYVRALNPSDTETHVQLAHELGLDIKQFGQDIVSAAVNQELLKQIDFGQSLGAMGFPSLILEHQGEHHFISHDYKDPEITLGRIDVHLSSDKTQHTQAG